MRSKRTIAYLSIVVIVAIAIALFSRNYSATTSPTEVPFSDLARHLKAEDVIKYESDGTKLTATLKDNNEQIVAYAANGYEIEWLSTKFVLPQMLEGKIQEVSSPKPSDNSILANILPSLFIIGILVVLMYYFMNNM